MLKQAKDSKFLVEFYKNLNKRLFLHKDDICSSMNSVVVYQIEANQVNKENKRKPVSSDDLF